MLRQGMDARSHVLLRDYFDSGILEVYECYFFDLSNSDHFSGGLTLVQK